MDQVQQRRFCIRNIGEVTVLKRNDPFIDKSSSSELDLELNSYASRRLEVDKLPSVDTLAAPKLCSTRLQHVIELLNHGVIIDKDDLINNLKYSISVLDTLYIEETKRLFDDDDALNEVEPDAVPTEVRDWLAQTFTRSQNGTRRGERPKFRSVAQAVCAGLVVDRLYRRMSSFSETSMQQPQAVAKILKDVHQWSFNIFELDEASSGNSLRYLGFELMKNQGLVSKLRINPAHIDNFLLALQAGYNRYGNPYHNMVHGADVAQTTHCLLQSSGLNKTLTDIETFATIIAALIHDYEHTGTTNNFHIMTSTPLAMLYNDKAVLENHHLSAAFELMRQEDKNILIGLKTEEFREFRGLVIDMVLATDMSGHFQQLKNMKSMLGCVENIEKSKVLSLILHTADIGHPSKPWAVHKRWTDNLIEEFFKQGDREKDLGLVCSPLCDRQTTLVEKSQIGFIDFIVEPSFNVLGDMMEKIVSVFHMKETSESGNHPVTILEDVDQESSDSSTDVSTPPIKELDLVSQWKKHLNENRLKWKELAGIEDETEKEVEKDAENPKSKVITRSTSTTGLRYEEPRPMNITVANRVLCKQTSTTGIGLMDSPLLFTRERSSQI
ncbi:dual specificity calcium/calmodulin-dependent 3',5'-cyclic nucleotide phosphodiesterase 1B-like isoform X2 [Watersipora subatra]|uniref:dual specificity calcium/calmodulin-dependent 3',5'-cyclic nucleotide phosphodiesterase 1B-like isoform X2 n=1 Tax=Watersipora subatra TaxID=2589382 RepID=UPI00355AD0E7